MWDCLMKMINGKEGFFLAQKKYKKKRHKSRHLVTEIGTRLKQTKFRLHVIEKNPSHCEF